MIASFAMRSVDDYTASLASAYDHQVWVSLTGKVFDHKQRKIGRISLTDRFEALKLEWTGDRYFAIRGSCTSGFWLEMRDH